MDGFWIKTKCVLYFGNKKKSIYIELSPLTEIYPVLLNFF
jgi:hypothetical protein